MNFKGGDMSTRKSKRFLEKLEDTELFAGYLVKHFVRMFLLVADDAWLFADSQILDDMSVKSLHSWLPDETSSMRPVWNETVGWLRRMTGISPLIVSCHACFLPKHYRPIKLHSCWMLTTKSCARRFRIGRPGATSTRRSMIVGLLHCPQC